MVSGLQLIQSNPAPEAFTRRKRQLEGSRRAALADETGRFRLDRARRDASSADTADRVLSGVVTAPQASQPQAAPARPSSGIRNIVTAQDTATRGSGSGRIEAAALPVQSNAPAPVTPSGTIRERGARALGQAGQGRAAFDLATEASDRRVAAATRAEARSDRQFDKFVTLLGQDRPEAAMTIAQQAGIKITPQFQAAIGNSFFRREFALRFARNKAVFKDPRQLEKQTQRDLIELLGVVNAANQRGGVPQVTAGADRIAPSADPTVVGQPFPDAQGRMFVRNKAGQAVPLRGPDGRQIVGQPRRTTRDPLLVSPTQRINAINKRLEVFNNDFNDERSSEEKQAAAIAEIDAQLAQGGATNPIFAGQNPAAQQVNDFDPEGPGFDMQRAQAAGMRPAGPEAGPNAGHFGSVAPVTPEEQQQFGVPPGSFVILKGRQHPTFHKAVEAEQARGFRVQKVGDRYFSVPANVSAQVPTITPPPIPGREPLNLNIPAPIPSGVQPLPIGLDGQPDRQRLLPGVVYDTPRGPLRYLGPNQWEPIAP